jgi:hypothetical protein
MGQGMKGSQSAALLARARVRDRYESDPQSADGSQGNNDIITILLSSIYSVVHASALHSAVLLRTTLAPQKCDPPSIPANVLETLINTGQDAIGLFKNTAKTCVTPPRGTAFKLPLP